MKKSIQSLSCKDLPKSAKELKTKAEINATSEHRSRAIAQLVPTLPESKFFPTSGRNLHISRASQIIGSTVSANISTTNSVNSSVINPGNLTVRNHSKNESLNFSIHSQDRVPESKAKIWTDIQLPTTPAVALKHFSQKLTDYEQSEILRYQHVYCIGYESKKVKPAPNAANNGFDDENGDYKVVIKDHIAYRYEVLDIIGKGSFGQVFKVYDYKHQTHYALKMIRSKPRFQQQALVEIEILKTVRKKDDESSYNVVHIQSSFQFRSHIVSPI